MSTPSEDQVPSAEGAPAAPAAAPKAKKPYVMTPARQAALDRANAARKLKAAERGAHATGLDLTDGAAAPASGARPGAPSSSVTPHDTSEPKPRAKPQPKAAPKQAPPPPATTPAPDATPPSSGARRGLFHALRIAAGLD